MEIITRKAEKVENVLKEVKKVRKKSLKKKLDKLYVSKGIQKY